MIAAKRLKSRLIDAARARAGRWIHRFAFPRSMGLRDRYGSGYIAALGPFVDLNAFFRHNLVAHFLLASLTSSASLGLRTLKKTRQ